MRCRPRGRDIPPAGAPDATAGGRVPASSGPKQHSRTWSASGGKHSASWNMKTDREVVAALPSQGALATSRLRRRRARIPTSLAQSAVRGLCGAWRRVTLLANRIPTDNEMTTPAD